MGATEAAETLGKVFWAANSRSFGTARIAEFRLNKNVIRSSTCANRFGPIQILGNLSHECREQCLSGSLRKMRLQLYPLDAPVLGHTAETSTIRLVRLRHTPGGKEKAGARTPPQNIGRCLRSAPSEAKESEHRHDSTGKERHRGRFRHKLRGFPIESDADLLKLRVPALREDLNLRE